ncbi:MAG: hypothetical protein ACLTKG_03810 [Collinsella intestinalis]
MRDGDGPVGLFADRPRAPSRARPVKATRADDLIEDGVLTVAMDMTDALRP